uniref:Uncharacterized protein n=1 Tax=Helianthus annuus TaxID=4232 RepID=A0A251V8N4_HELAN
MCTNCKKNGHTADTCYRLIGFPKEFKFTKSKRFAANVSSESHDINSEQSGSKSTTTNCGLTSEQYNGLLQLLNNVQMGSASFANNNNTAVNSANFADICLLPRGTKGWC